MSVQVRCPACSTVNVLEVNEDGIARCPGCGKAIRLKSTQPAAPAAAIAFADERTANELAKDDDQDDATQRPKSEKRKKKKKKDREPESSRGKLWIGVGGALGVGALVVVILLLRGGGNGNVGGPNGGGPGEKLGPHGAIIEAPLPNIVAEVSPKVEYKVAAAEKPRWISLSSAQQPALWKIEADTPPNPPVTLAADLDIRIPLTPAAEVVRPPVCAGLNGPFVVPGPQWKEKVYEKEYDRKTAKYVDKDRPQPPAQVFDIRTGKAVGGFNWRVNPGMPGTCLSPEGRILVSPDPNVTIERDATSREGILFVWTQDKEEPAKLQLDGSVSWLGFIGPTKLAAMSFKPDPSFSVWDVATTKLERSTPLPASRFGKPIVRVGDSYPKFPFNPHNALGAISPTGKYVAFATPTGVSLLATSDGKEVGHISIVEPMNFLQFKSMTFSPDGADLYAAVVMMHSRPSVSREPRSNTWPKKPQVLNKGVQGVTQQTVLKRWDVATGRLTLDRAIMPVPPSRSLPHMHGKIMPGPISDTFLFGAGSTIYLHRPLAEEGFGYVVETVVGTVVDKIDFDPVYIGGNGQMLGIFKVDAKKHALRSVHYDEKTVLDRGGAKLSAVAGRPTAKQAVRGGAAVGPPQPPEDWTMPPAVAAFETPGDVATMPSWPTVFAETSAADLRPKYQEQPTRREEMFWHALDPKTGQAVGKERLLYPWVYPPHEWQDSMKPHDIPPAALSADGKRIAVIDPANHDRVDAWDQDGKHQGAIVPCPDYCVDWIGWSAAGKLLTLSHGKMAAWDVATGKTSYEVDGGYPGPVALAPGRGWVAVCGTDAVDLIDAETGRCHGRCRPKSAGGGFVGVSIAPDGKHLAAARPLVLPPDPKERDPAQGPPSRRATSLMGDIWDLSTGTPVEIPFGIGRLQFLQWRSQRLLLAGSIQPNYEHSRLEVLDPAIGLVATFAPPKSYMPLGSAGPSILASPDGRAWYSVKNPDAAAKTPYVWYAPSLFGVDTKAAVLTAADRKYFDLPKEAIRVEVQLGQRNPSAKIAERLAGDLQRGGFTIGPNNMVLKLTYTLRDGSAVLKNDSGSVQVTIPEVMFHYRLLDETGAEIWEATKVGQFAWTKSRFYTGSTMDKGFPRDRHGQPDMRFFDFPGPDPRKAIAEEIIENWSDAPEVALPPAAMLVRAGGVTRILPIREEAKLP
ncbi:MAG: hypothetical protein L0Y72_17560 [Gemmataceae bacterium]|nr:hypothetical protein [Gemmataceae bacterium]MCI0740859.1 hypothetical protein [Gemmataceae bacterium]